MRTRAIESPQVADATVKVGLKGQYDISVPELRHIIEGDLEANREGQSGQARSLRDVIALADDIKSSLRDGLKVNEEDFELRKKVFGVNKLPGAKSVSFWELVVEAFQDFTLMLLLGSGVLSIVLGRTLSTDRTEDIEGAAILISVCICVLVSAVTNYQKEKKFQQLNTIKDDIQVRVVRDSKERSISTFDLLVGDVVMVETGDILPADGLLFQGDEIKVDESHLTGESDDVIKDPAEYPILMSGSKIMEGFGKMLVLAVGENCQQGIINKMILTGDQGEMEGGQVLSSGEIESTGSRPGGADTDALQGNALREDTVLVKKLEQLAKDIGNFGVGAAVAVLIINVCLYSWELVLAGSVPWSLTHLEEYLKFFITSITILVVAVPEGLPLAVTLALAFSVQQMLNDNNLVRHLDACETMGCATTICSDKTGTLTENNMKVVRLWSGQKNYKVRPSDTKQGPSCPLPGCWGETYGGVNGIANAWGTPNGSGGSNGYWMNGYTGAVENGAGASTSSIAYSSMDGYPLDQGEDDQVYGNFAYRGLQSWPSSRPGSPSDGDGRESVTSPSPAPAVVKVSAKKPQRIPQPMSLLSLSMDDESLLGRGPLPFISDTPGNSEEQPSLSPVIRELMVLNIALNSTASIQVNSVNGCVQSGNRTECALLEFATRLTGQVSPFERIELLRRQHHVLASFPFTSARKQMSVVVAGPAFQDRLSVRIFTKGASEIVLGECDAQLGPDGTILPLPDAEKRELMASFSKEGLRMLALAYRDHFIPHPALNGNQINLSAEAVESSLILIGLVGLEDPVRKEVPKAIEQCVRAGITVRMLTGDNVRTGAAIARQCGILPKNVELNLQPAEQEALMRKRLEEITRSDTSRRMTAETSGTHSHNNNGLPKGSIMTNVASRLTRLLQGSETSASTTASSLVLQRPDAVIPDPRMMVMEGATLRRLVTDSTGKLDEVAFYHLWPHLRVVARCTPSDKYLLVTALKRLRTKGLLHEVVAMTGDGTNDAPALSVADVGFAMNSGTSIAKDASDILLMDDNFTSIVSAVKWGRNVYASITKFLQFQLTANIVAVATACVGALVLRESPLSAVQMLWVNLIMDSLASLALATEPPTDDILDDRPVSSSAPLITPTVAKNIVGQAVYQLGVMYVLVFFGGEALGVDNEVKNTLVFNSFVMMQLFNQVNCRKVRDEPDIFSGLASHKLFLAILGAEAIMQVAIVQCGGKAFQTVPLNWSQWGICIGTGALTLLIRQGMRRLRVHDRRDLNKSRGTSS